LGRADVTAIEQGFTERAGTYATVVGTAIVHLRERKGSLPYIVQENSGVVTAQDGWGYIPHRYNSQAGRRIIAAVGRPQGDGVDANIGARKCIGCERECKAAIVGTDIVYRSWRHDNVAVCPEVCRYVLAARHGCNQIPDGYARRTSAGIAALVSTRQRDRAGSKVGTGIQRLTQHKSGDRAVVETSVVDGRYGKRGLPVGIQVQGRVLANHGWRKQIHNDHIGGTGRGVSVAIIDR